jgi:hypothetical protein
VPPFVRESMFSQSYLYQKIVDIWIEGKKVTLTSDTNHSKLGQTQFRGTIHHKTAVTLGISCKFRGSQATLILPPSV